MRTSLERHLGSRQVARTVYGAIVGLTLVVVLHTHPPAAGVTVLWLLGTAVTVALAEVYSEVVGVETSQRHGVTRRQLAHMLDDAVAVAFGVACPAVFFVLAWLDLLEVETAFRVATWSGLGLIGFYGFWAARFAGAGMPRALAHGAAVAAVGLVVIGLKAVLH